jgi:glycosyltransferase involved in cell wall biosynthesis
MDERPTILLIGPTPPPHHGVSVAMQMLLTSSVSEAFRVVHLEIADRRGIGHVDQPDLHDVLLFTQQWFRHLALILRERPALCYLPISQTRLGFFRDSLFIVPALLAGIPVVLHLHGANFDAMHAAAGPLWRAYMGMILKRVARFIVLGETLRPIFSRWASPERISVVPNGVARASGGPRPSIPFDKGLFRVVCLSSLSRQKGLFMLLQAVPLVVNAHRGVEFLIAGPWWGEETRHEAEAMVAHLGIMERVRFVGAVTGEQKSDFLRSGMLFVFPAIQQEGQPMTVLEAMSEGLPVVATDRGCLRETVVDGVTGFIVPPGSPEALAEKIIELIRRPALRDEMAENALKRVEQCYTTEQFAARVSEVFHQVITAAPARNAHGLGVGCRP